MFHHFTILNFKNPGVSVDGVLSKNSTHKLLALSVVMKMWCKAIYVFEARFSNFLAYLANRLSQSAEISAKRRVRVGFLQLRRVKSSIRNKKRFIEKKKKKN